MEAATARRTRGKTGGTGRENLRQDAAGQSHPRRAGVRHPLHPLPALANGRLRPDHRLAALTGRKSEHRQRGAQLPVADGLLDSFVKIALRKNFFHGISSRYILRSGIWHCFCLELVLPICCGPVSL